MKPAPFEYHKPADLKATLALLAELGEDDCKVLAGGQSLMPLLNMRLVRPNHVVDINGLAELDYVRAENGTLAMGALTRHRTLEYSEEVAAGLPLVAESVPLIGDRQIRYRGTIGGSLVHADPSAELPIAAVALDAEMVLGSAAGRRTVSAEEFFLGTLMTVLEPQELLLEVRFPSLQPRTGCAFVELARQHGAFAIVAAAVSVTLEGDRIANAQICLGGASPAPVRARQAEDRLRGETPSDSLLREAAQLAADVTDPSGDVHGSPEYRREMAGVYTRRGLEAAITRARNMTA